MQEESSLYQLLIELSKMNKTFFIYTLGDCLSMIFAKEDFQQRGCQIQDGWRKFDQNQTWPVFYMNNKGMTRTQIMHRRTGWGTDRQVTNRCNNTEAPTTNPMQHRHSPLGQCRAKTLLNAPLIWVIWFRNKILFCSISCL